MAVPFPFSAIVAQDEMKLAILAVAVDPSIGGVLVFGDRGTGKSTAVRSLAALLPPIKVATGCPYGCDPAATAGLCEQCAAAPAGKARPGKLVPVPVVDLPLGATEDRVVGALDLERALSQGVKAFEPGLLARANRGFLYIDEVNLLEDHLVDLLQLLARSHKLFAYAFVLRGPLRGEALGIALEGIAAFHHLDARGQVRRRLHFHRQAEAIQQLRTQLALLRVAAAHEHEARGVAHGQAFAFDHVLA